MGKEQIKKDGVALTVSSEGNASDRYLLQKDRARAVRETAIAVSHHCAACILDDSGRILLFTEKFPLIIDQGFVAQIDLERRKPKLILSERHDQLRFDALLQPVFDREHIASDGLFTTKRWIWRVLVRELDCAPPDTTPKLRAPRQFMVRFINLKNKPPVRRYLHVLHDVYFLTPAEQNLCAELLESTSLPDAAGRLGVKVSTARTQLKSIFDKVGVHSQTALIARLTALIMRFECTSFD